MPLLVVAAVLGLCVAVRDAARIKQNTMRDDDMAGISSPDDLPCVDCPEYVQLTAEQKLQRLWAKISSDAYPGGSFPVDWANLFTVNFRDLRQHAWNGTMPFFFDRFSDENPTQHAKVIHTYGSVAKVRFEPLSNDMGLTGMFRDGAEHAVVRLSIVADWTKPCKGGTDLNFKGCFKPSMALKMLRDGDFSSNFVAQVNLGDGVGQDFNFFNHTHATWLPTPWGMGALVVKKLFAYASKADEIGGVGLEELASGGSKMKQRPEDIKAPKLIYLVPSDEVHYRFPSEEHDVRADFAQIEPGTALYDVVGVGEDPSCYVKKSGQPTDPVAYEDLQAAGCKHSLLGRIVTTSRFVASAWGDRRLFFQHERLKTKGGAWARRACASSGHLPGSSEYRMPSDLVTTCTQECPAGTEPAPQVRCPFAELEEP